MSYVTSAEEVLCGVSLVALTMAIHGCGMLVTLMASHAMGHGSARRLSFLRGGTILISASWMIVLVHLIEVLVWAAFFLWLNAMPDASTAYYFALMQYTTVGSDITLPLRWRLLGGMLPIAALMAFAWSTGVLFMLAQEFQSTQLAAMHARQEARRVARESARRRPGGKTAGPAT